MTLFEYKIINSKIGTKRISEGGGEGKVRVSRFRGGGGSEIEVLEDMINDLSTKGWEAVNITASNPYQKESFMYCLLKRKKEL